MTGRRLAVRLKALGAEELLPIGLGDDQHPNGYEASLDPWVIKLWQTLRARCPLPPGKQEVNQLSAPTCPLNQARGPVDP